MSKNTTPGARRVVPRSRGALSGIALIVLGLWGALIPFVGPYFNFSFTPDDAWHWSTARGWLEVLPGAAAFVAGFLLLVSQSRAMTLVAAWLGIAAGAWFAVGPQLQDVWHIGSPGRPAGSGAGVRALEVLALFTLLGVVIVYFAATAFGRLSVVSLRDAHAADRRESEAAAEAERERQASAARERDAAAAREREAAEAAAAHERRAADRGSDEPTRQDADTIAPTAAPVAAAVPAQDEQTDDRPAHADRGAHVVSHETSRRRAEPQAEPQPQQTYEQPQAQPQQTYEQPQAQPQPQPQPQPQRTYEQPQAYPAQQQPDQEPVREPDASVPSGSGYAQPQQYDPQHGFARPDTSSEQPAEGEHQSLAQRLFHRR